ncbi:SAM-dependent methyltransferase [Nocardia sp. GAS34]
MPLTQSAGTVETMSHDHQHHHSAHHPGHPYDGHDHGDESALADMLDLDAEVLHEYHAEVFALIRERAGDGPVRRILDMGAGTGIGALALAQGFPGAEVTAVDLSPFMLAHLEEKARTSGVADRVHVLRADLDAGWPDLGAVELAWASNSLHHMADPVRVLNDLFDTIRPGGLLALAELNSLPRFLSGELGDLEERCYAAAAAETAEHVPHLGSDWAPMLTKAGFDIEIERHFEIDLAPPLPAATGRYAHSILQRMRAGVAERLSPADLTALDTLILEGPDTFATRPDLTVRADRSLWIARRP